MEGNKNIVADALSRFPITGNQEAAHGPLINKKLCHKSMTLKN